MSDIVLTTFNARWSHASFGLRYLRANLSKQLHARSHIVEFETKTNPTDAVAKVLALDPKIVGVGVYIWNARQSLEFVRELKRIAPQVVVVIGGPEVSYEVERQEICALADFVICGEADLAFAQLCEQILSARRPLMRIIQAQLPEFFALKLPYDEYADEDVAHRVVYVEASRGCPFKCEFCLSSLDVPVRNVPLELFLEAMQKFLDRGVQQFKFVDRTFNLNLNFSRSILEFFLQRYREGLFLHFEMIPDRLPEALRATIEKFPPGALQFEVGVQTFNDDVAVLISRKQDNARLEDNLRWLKQKTGVHVHADLIVGLPGEDLASFARGFDRLVNLAPQEIQVGMLKRLRGTPIVRHNDVWGMIYSSDAPYEIIQTKLVDAKTMSRLSRFARFWDLLVNSGNFIESSPMVWMNASPFAKFLDISDWLFARFNQTHAIALEQLAEALFKYLIDQNLIDREKIAQTIWRDYSRGARRDVPKFLREFVATPDRATRLAGKKSSLPARQARRAPIAQEPIA